MTTSETVLINFVASDNVSEALRRIRNNIMLTETGVLNLKYRTQQTMFLLERSMNSLAIAMGLVQAGLTAVYSKVIQNQMEIERLAKLTATISGRTFDDVYNSALKLTKELPNTTSEIVQLEYELAKLGVKNNLDKITETAIKLGDVFGEDVVTMGKIVTMANKMGSNVTTVGDEIAKSFETSSMNLRKLRYVMQNAQGVYSALGFSFEDLLTSATLVSKYAEINPTRLGTGLKIFAEGISRAIDKFKSINIKEFTDSINEDIDVTIHNIQTQILELQKQKLELKTSGAPKEKIQEISEQIQRLKLQLKELKNSQFSPEELEKFKNIFITPTGQMKSYAEIIEGLGEYFNQIDNNMKKVQLIQKIFGRDGSTTIMTLLSHYKEFNKTQEEIINSQGNLNKKFNDFMNTIENKIKKIKSLLEVIGGRIIFGDADRKLKGTYDTLIKILDKVINFLNKFEKSTTLEYIIGYFNIMLENLYTFMNVFDKSFNWFDDKLRENKTFIYDFVHAVKNVFEILQITIGIILNRIWGYFNNVSIIKRFKNIVTADIKTIVHKLANIKIDKNKIEKNINNIINKFNELYNKIKEKVNKITEKLNGIKDKFKEIENSATNMKDTITTVINDMINDFDKLLNKINDVNDNLEKTTNKPINIDYLIRNNQEKNQQNNYATNKYIEDIKNFASQNDYLPIKMAIAGLLTYLTYKFAGSFINSFMTVERAWKILTASFVTPFMVIPKYINSLFKTPKIDIKQLYSLNHLEQIKNLNLKNLELRKEGLELKKKEAEINLDLIRDNIKIKQLQIKSAEKQLENLKVGSPKYLLLEAKISKYYNEIEKLTLKESKILYQLDEIESKLSKIKNVNIEEALKIQKLNIPYKPITNQYHIVEELKVRQLPLIQRTIVHFFDSIGEMFIKGFDVLFAKLSGLIFGEEILVGIEYKIKSIFHKIGITIAKVIDNLPKVLKISFKELMPKFASKPAPLPKELTMTINEFKKAPKLMFAEIKNLISPKLPKVNILKPFTNIFNTLPKIKIPTTGMQFIKDLSGITSVSKGVGSITKMFTSLIKVLGTFTVILDIIFVAIETVRTAFYALETNLYGFKTALETSADLLQGKGLNIIDVILKIGAVFDIIYKIVANAIVAIISFITPIVSGFISAIGSIASSVIDSFSYLFNIIGIIKTNITWFNKLSQVIGTVGSIIGYTIGIIGKVIGTGIRLIAWFIGGLIEFSKWIGNLIIKFLQGNTIGRTILNIIHKTINSIVDLINYIYNGLKWVYNNWDKIILNMAESLIGLKYKIIDFINSISKKLGFGEIIKYNKKDVEADKRSLKDILGINDKEEIEKPTEIKPITNESNEENSIIPKELKLPDETNINLNYNESLNELSKLNNLQNISNNNEGIKNNINKTTSNISQIVNKLNRNETIIKNIFNHTKTINTTLNTKINKNLNSINTNTYKLISVFKNVKKQLDEQQSRINHLEERLAELNERKVHHSSTVNASYTKITNSHHNYDNKKINITIHTNDTKDAIETIGDYFNI